MKVTPADVTLFILANYARARTDYNIPKLYNWVAWHMENDSCIMIADATGNALAGVLLARTVFDPHLHANDVASDPEGDTYFIDLCIALSPKRDVLQGLSFALLRRFGQRDKIAFQRHGTGKVIVSDAHAHRRKLLRFLTPQNYVHPERSERTRSS